MATQTACPTADQLRDLLEGRLADSDQTELTAHLHGCESCRLTLDEFATAGQAMSAAARNLKQVVAPEAPLQDVIDKLKMTTPSLAETQAGDAHAGDPSLSFLLPPKEPGHLGRFDEFEVLGLVGRGGMGVVLKALDEDLRRVVAIKVMAPQLAANATARRRFQREGQAAAAVSHDHIVTIHGVAEANGLPCIIMQYVAGESLQDRLDRVGPLEIKEILRIGMQTASGLAAAHAQGLIHRDIKPGNILLENGIARVKITDFGLARTVDDASVTQSGVISGTPMYMAPEQAQGETIDHRADLFSLGSVLYALCTGHPPFRATGTMAVLKRVIEDTPRPIREINPEIPDWLCEIVAKLHAKKPADRFQSAKEVAELLEQHLAHLQQPSQVAMPGRVERPKGKPIMRRGSALLVVAASVISSIFIIGWPTSSWLFLIGFLSSLFLLVGLTVLILGRTTRRAWSAMPLAAPIPPPELLRRRRRMLVPIAIVLFVFIGALTCFGSPLYGLADGTGEVTLVTDDPLIAIGVYERIPNPGSSPILGFMPMAPNTQHYAAMVATPSDCRQGSMGSPWRPRPTRTLRFNIRSPWIIAGSSAA